MYKEFSHYYDKVFQSNKKQIKFIANRTPDKGKILDLAAGTGNQVIALDQLEYDVSALEYDHSMYMHIMRKMKSEKTSKQLIEGDMRDIELFFQPYTFNTIFCIGNSIVHLTSLKEIEDVVRKAFILLKPHGALLIQNINYDRILKEQVSDLPTIINDDDPKERIEFERSYKLVNQNKIIFETRLKIFNINTLTHEIQGEVSLYPLLSKELENILSNTGFKQVNLYSSFQEEKYHSNAYALVVEARK